MDFLHMGILFFYFSLLAFAFLPSSSASQTVLVDGFTKWKDPAVDIGDSIIFRHKYRFGLCIFRSKMAFNLCDFKQATCLTTPNSASYTWHPSRLGNFYFSFNDGTDKACQQGQKLAIKVTPQTAAPPPAISAEPPQTPPSSGRKGPSSPAYPWPFQPHEKSDGPDTSYAPFAAATPPLLPDGKGKSIPFINSNPAIPLPTGEVDTSATVGPLPTSVNHNHALPQVQVSWLLGAVIPQCTAILLLMIL